MRVYYVSVLIPVFLILNSQCLVAGHSASPVDPEVVMQTEFDCRMSFSSGALCAKEFFDNTPGHIWQITSRVAGQIAGFDLSHPQTIAFLLGAHAYLEQQSLILLAPPVYEYFVRTLPLKIHAIDTSPRTDQ